MVQREMPSDGGMNDNGSRGGVEVVVVAVVMVVVVVVGDRTLECKGRFNVCQIVEDPSGGGRGNVC